MYVCTCICILTVNKLFCGMYMNIDLYMPTY